MTNDTDRQPLSDAERLRIPDSWEDPKSGTPRFWIPVHLWCEFQNPKVVDLLLDPPSGLRLGTIDI